MAVPESLITAYPSESPFAEAFRYLRTNLMLRNGHGNGDGQGAPRVIGIVGALPGTGSSTIAANLAISMTEVSRQVLLIDADLRRPTLDRLFGTKREPGLADVLSGTIPLTEALQETAVQGLRLLPGGRPRSVSRARFEAGISDVMKRARETFEAVIVDTPAAAIFPDAIIMAPHLDGVVVVAKANQPRTAAFDDLRRRLEHAHATLLGVIFNRVNPQDDEGLRFYKEYARPR